jgi:cobalt-zinc-cadmium efflux system membrane fusion protein
MKLWYLAVAALAAGCSRPAPEAAKTDAPKGESAAREVVLTDVMQREGKVEIETVSMRSVPRVVRASGRVTVNELRTWRVGAVTDGRVVRVYANPGDMVKQGDVLARMHSHDIHESRAHYRKALADLSRLKSAEAYALKVRDRMRRLYELKAASQEQVDHAESEYRNAQAATRQAEVELERTRLHLSEFLQIAPERDHPPVDHEEDHGDEDLIPIKAPAAGVVLARNVTPGTVVSPSMDMFVITDLARIWVLASVNEEHLAKLRPGLPARVSVQAYPGRVFAGVLTKIGEELDPATRTIRARVEVPNESGQLKPEMYATVEILAGGTEPALLVPPSAPQEVGGQTAVFVHKGNGRFEVRPIATGRMVEGFIEVLAGLRDGERVVTRGAFVLKSQLLKSTLGE